MKKFIIVTDTCSDLSKEQRARYSIEYVPMHYTYDDKDFVADLDWNHSTPREFYDIMRGGKRVITSQVNTTQYLEVFEGYIKGGYDILSISCSSALSASVNASYAAREELLAKYPDAKIICIDALNSCAGLGILCIKAAMLRDEGKSIDEVAAWVEDNRRYINQEASVDKLVYLKRAGRVSAASAFFGGLLNIKPIIISDAKGRNVAVEKVKGRAVAMNRLVERFSAGYIPSDMPIIVSHADAPEEAEELRKMVIAALPEDSKAEVITGYIGPIVGASVGPATLGIFYHGKEVTFSAEE
ncbi:MAG: DegV family protein [Clostridia bacterium]|nr:DegV family protein [Clostridia bacterium]MBQ8371719.1 DegV family protein [Clostridia bacterium]